MEIKMIRCESCGEMISERAWSCPKCGGPNYTYRKKFLPSIILIIIVAAVIAFMKLIWGDSEEYEKSPSRTRIIHTRY